MSELAYAPPGADQLFFDVSFGVAPGEHAALVGVNGVGKSTILRILSGELDLEATPSAVPTPPAITFARKASELLGHLFGGDIWN